MKEMLLVTLVLFINPALQASTSPIQGEQIGNPQKYVLSHAEFPEKGLVQFDCSHCSTMKDTLFVAATQECGNAGCNHGADTIASL